MDKRDPISFQQRKRERQAKRAGVVKQRPTQRPSPARAGGETDDVREYWARFIHHPFSGSGRFLWTERMLWGNALLASILTTIGIAVEVGFHLLTMISVFINAFFLFFLAYYLFPWVADWILRQHQKRVSSVDTLKLEMIVLSGWLVIASLVRLVPVYYPLPYFAALLAFAVLVMVAVHRQVRVPWSQSALATAGGVMSVAIVMAILSSF
ncbi:MAG: hypothetical protein C7B45_09370 [Sulfobacillus acidophilus]|uniref:Uncharacterized protein n=1 Tax=Sulfobacillus acidophilus TaxID=53633 RepID=A0A2T2WHS1_9FIRM|nr:MAG: hypothetical protein C7B45_09370 [Sulfobacillus acidophilus]